MTSPTWLMIAAIASAVAPALGSLAKENKQRGLYSLVLAVGASETAAIAAGVDDPATLVSVAIGAMGVQHGSYRAILKLLFDFNDKVDVWLGRVEAVDPESVEEHIVRPHHAGIAPDVTIEHVDVEFVVADEAFDEGTAEEVDRLLRPEDNTDFLDLLGVGPEEVMGQ